MTRRGSLAYYLAAIAVGCFAQTVCLWLYYVFTDHPHPGLLNLYFLSLLTGSFAALMFAFFLRLVLRFTNLQSGWQGSLAGAVLSLLLVWGAGSFATTFELAQQGPLWMAMLGGPTAVALTSPWLAIPAGAGTAFVLWRIHRAFAPPPAASLSAELRKNAPGEPHADQYNS
jgi:hypothetical protein